MKELRFVTAEELDKPPYASFSVLAQYERDHPLHRLYEYVTQYFGGIREDVLEFFCNEASVNQLANLIEEAQDPGLRNEWYRRLVRLLQCNAEADWYKMFCVSTEKSKGYTQYFLNQLAGYAEMGIPAKTVEQMFEECNAAYLLEYRIRQWKRKEEVLCETEQLPVGEEKPDFDEAADRQKEVMQEPMEELLQQLMQPILEGQKKVQDMLETLLLQKKEVPEQVERAQEEETAIEEHIEEEVSEQQAVVCDELSKEESVVKNEENKAREAEISERRENAVKIANLFQQIRLKRKSVKLRKMDQKQQLQELIIKMTQKKFSTEDMAIVRGLIDCDISLEFLYIIISEEPEPVKRLKQMYEFMAYQPEA